MKNVLLSADGDILMYSVPDFVADKLLKYCLEFLDWINSIQSNPDARKKYSIEGVVYVHGMVVYDGIDTFIDYLNCRYPHEKSVFIKNIGSDLPEKYRDYPSFNF